MFELWLRPLRLLHQGKFGPKGIRVGWINLNRLASLSRRCRGQEEGREGGGGGGEGGGCGDGQVKVLGELDTSVHSASHVI